jgi:hypothetical protein
MSGLPAGEILYVRPASGRNLICQACQREKSYMSGLPAGEILFVRPASGRNLICQACQREKSYLSGLPAGEIFPWLKISPVGMPDRQKCKLCPCEVSNATERFLPLACLTDKSANCARAKYLTPRKDFSRWHA